MNMSKLQGPSHAPQATLYEANLRTSRVSSPQVVGLKILSPADDLAATLPLPATAGSTRLETGERENCNPVHIHPDILAMAKLNSARILTHAASPINEREIEVPKMAPSVSVPSENLVEIRFKI